MDCGNVSKINKEGNMYKCRACGSFNIETKDKDYYNDIEIHAIVDEEELIEDQVATEDYLKSFEITIDMNTNVGKIYIELINGARDKYRNYTKEIAEKWGTSQTNVMHAVKKLQKKFNNFREE
jgi:hypothetical protein